MASYKSDIEIAQSVTPKHILDIAKVALGEWLDLDDSFALYTEGTKLLKYCNSYLRFLIIN